MELAQLPHLLPDILRPIGIWIPFFYYLHHSWAARFPAIHETGG